MEDNADLHDWELLRASDFTDNCARVAILNENAPNLTIMNDYFASDSGTTHRLQSEESEDGNIDSDNPSCTDSDSNSVFETAKDLGFAGPAFLSDESSDGKTSVMEMGSEEKREMREIGCEKKEKMWWKVSVGLIRYCFVGVRPVWSLSIAAAVVGVVMLWRKMYRVKQRSRSILLKLGFDEKKTSQFAARSARLNAAFSVVRRMPAIRPSLQEGVATQWAALPLR